MKSISVVIPVYNTEKYVSEAIESVLSQSYPAEQVVVVNDGSTDGTAKILDSIRGIQVIHQENKGIGPTLNNALEITNSQFISFLDADDLWYPNKLEKQMIALEKMDYSGIVFGQIEQFLSMDIDHSLEARLETPKKFLPGVHRSTMLIDRKSMDLVGWFSTEYLSEEFLDWYLRAKEALIPTTILDEVVARRRIHGGNITLGYERKEKNEFPSIIKQALDRRRSNQ